MPVGLLVFPNSPSYRVTKPFSGASIVSFIFPILLLCGCTREPRDIRTLVEANGRFLSPVDGQPYSGPFIEFFPDTPAVKRIGNFRKGLLNGTITAFRKNSDTVSVSTYRLGLLDGPYRSFSEDGCVDASHAFEQAVDTTALTGVWTYTIRCYSSIYGFQRFDKTDSLYLTLTATLDNDGVASGPITVMDRDGTVGMSGEFSFGYPDSWWTFSDTRIYSLYDFIHVFDFLRYSNVRSVFEPQDHVSYPFNKVPQVVFDKLIPTPLLESWKLQSADTSQANRARLRERFRKTLHAAIYFDGEDMSVRFNSFRYQIGDEFEITGGIQAQYDAAAKFDFQKFTCIPAGNFVRTWTLNARTITDTVPPGASENQPCELNSNSSYDRFGRGRRPVRYLLPVRLKFLPKAR